MQKYKKPLFTEADLGINPHINTLLIPVVKWEDVTSFKKDEEIFNFNTYDIEVEKKVSIYKSKERRLLYNKLKPTTCKLYLWIQQETKDNKDYLWINKERYIEETETTYKTYKQSVDELVAYCVITPTNTRDVYWLNPSLFFSGNRLKKYPNNIVITQDRTN